MFEACDARLRKARKSPPSTGLHVHIGVIRHRLYDEDLRSNQFVSLPQYASLAPSMMRRMV